MDIRKCTKVFVPVNTLDQLLFGEETEVYSIKPVDKDGFVEMMVPSNWLKPHPDFEEQDSSDDNIFVFTPGDGKSFLVFDQRPWITCQICNGSARKLATHTALISEKSGAVTQVPHCAEHHEEAIQQCREIIDNETATVNIIQLP